MKALISILFVTFGLLFVSPLMGQTSSSTTPLRLRIKNKINKGEYYEIQYEITKPGFVELHLYNSKYEKLYIKGRVTDRTGLDKIRFSTKPLESGKHYPFVLKYKGKDYKGTIFL
ncbi:MAG: hypothetical protein AAFY71_20990 [Bacteroidota bacterium]